MASLLLTLLLVCVAAPWAESALKELGEACTAASDTCVHPTLDTVCDQGGMCRIKEGQACSGSGYSTLCVLGAECTSNTCTCKGTFYTSDGSTGKCTAAEDKYGGACPSGSGGCTGTNLECVGTTVCLCTQSGGYTPNLADGTCTEVAAEKIGKKCTVNNKDADCGTTTNLDCTGSTLECTCTTGFAGPRGGSCAAIAQQLVGRTCTAGTATDAGKCGTAATTNLECNANTNTECNCDTNYYGVTGGACYAAKGSLGGVCEATSDCTGIDSNSECGTGTPKTCQCVAQYYDNSGTCAQIAAMKVGKTCDPANTPEADTACGDPATTFLECTGNSNTECACKSGYSGSIGGDCSKNSGAVELVGSLVTVTLAAILHVFMRD